MKRLSFIAALLCCLGASLPAARARLSGGAAWGLGSTPYGESVNSENTPSNSAYNGSTAGPFNGGVEILFPRPTWRPGAALWARPWNESRESAVTGAVTRSNKSQADFSSLDLLAEGELAWALDKGRAFSFFSGLGLGLGVMTGGRTKEETIQTTGSSLIASTRERDWGLGLGPAARLWAGLGWRAQKGVALHLALEGAWASFSPAPGKESTRTVDHTGTELGSSNGNAPALNLQRLSLGLQAGIGFDF